VQRVLDLGLSLQDATDADERGTLADRLTDLVETMEPG
jgi:hypothetical protein